ncbi:MAG: peptide chain release factor N(5)-glutamine methyltransferase [Christensenella sp.]|nr:peptide chain release factor N(5)-glutamine methyltransferase [Christensenella sp.]
MSVTELVRLAQLRLEPVAGEEAAQQAKLIVSAVIGVEPAALMVHTWVQADEEQIAVVGEMLERRVAGEPLQYILGEWSFMGLPFYVDSRALIPRQDTELLCETALKLIQERGYRTCLDLCAGSGCIGISIAKLGGIAVTAADISQDALSLVQENADLNEVQISLKLSDLFASVTQSYDLIACNPPYLSQADMDALQREVSFEPKMALFGGEDGLDFYRAIAKTYQKHLNKDGTLLLEIGSTQAKAAAALFDAKTSVLKDLCGNDRVLVIEP